MQIIDREMKSSKTNIEHTSNCQASINSDGLITLRNYNFDNNDKDTIIVLSREETNALIKLFQCIKDKFKVDDLPF